MAARAPITATVADGLPDDLSLVVACGRTGTLYATAGNGVVAIDPVARTKRLIAGNGLCRTTDGTGVSASFCAPAGIALRRTSPFNLLYVAETGGNCIRTVDRNSGRVQTLAGPDDGAGGDPGWDGPRGLALTADDKRLFVTEYEAGRVRVIHLHYENGDARVDRICILRFRPAVQDQLLYAADVALVTTPGGGLRLYVAGGEADQLDAYVACVDVTGREQEEEEKGEGEEAFLPVHMAFLVSSARA